MFDEGADGPASGALPMNIGVTRPPDTAAGGMPAWATARVEGETTPRGVEDVIPKVRNDGWVATWNCDAVNVG